MTDLTTSMGVARAHETQPALPPATSIAHAGCREAHVSGRRQGHVSGSCLPMHQASTGIMSLFTLEEASAQVDLVSVREAHRLHSARSERGLDGVVRDEV